MIEKENKFDASIGHMYVIYCCHDINYGTLEIYYLLLIIPNLYSNNGKKTKSLYLAYITPYVIATQLIYTYKFKYCTVKNYIAQTYVGKLFGDRDF